MTYNEFLKTKFSDGLNDGQLSFFREFLSSQRNIFLTGGAGVGKSFVLSRFSDFCESEGIYLNKCASTGVAAININSQTLHSYLGVGLGDGSIDVVVGKVRKNKLARKRLQNCRLIFIDEISMISGEFLDKFYAIIKAFCRRIPRVIIYN
jgi:ATP-dependent DNA helicase PIF1